LPGQAGGIVAMIFDLVTLSYRTPACPAKLTRPRALRRALWLMGGNFDFFAYLCRNPFTK